LPTGMCISAAAVSRLLLPIMPSVGTGSQIKTGGLYLYPSFPVFFLRGEYSRT